MNVVGTANVLAALEARPGAHLIYASSADVYGVPERIPVDEDAPLRPTNVYAASKAAAEALVREFGDRRDHPTVILRPANTNGFPSIAGTPRRIRPTTEVDRCELPAR